MRSRVRRLLVVAGALAAPGMGACSEAEPATEAERTGARAEAWETYADPGRGFAISFPPSWRRATESMSRISEPRELVSLGTTVLRRHATDCEAFAGSAGASMDGDDVVITLWERGHDPRSEWRDFPPRPRRFGPVADAQAAGRGCGEPPGTTIHWRNVTDSGRHLHTLVRVGPEAPADAVAQSWSILDTLQLDPDYRPDWPSSG
jgi:hypothetical protein